MTGTRLRRRSRLRIDGWRQVQRVLALIDAVDALGVDPADVAPDHWRHVHNRLSAGQEPNPYLAEWEDFVEAIRQDQPYNEARRGAEASLVSSMGRMAAHTGQIITGDEILDCPHEFAPDVDKLAADSPAPLLADATGKYPVPQPGLVKDREY